MCWSAVFVYRNGSVFSGQYTVYSIQLLIGSSITSHVFHPRPRSFLPPLPSSVTGPALTIHVFRPLVSPSPVSPSPSPERTPSIDEGVVNGPTPCREAQLHSQRNFFLSRPVQLDRDIF